MEPGSTPPLHGGSEILVTERRWHAHVSGLRRIVARAMDAAGCAADVVLTDDRTIKFLNAQDRGKNKPTNVLTYEQPPEILLAFGVVQREAVREQKTIAAHLSHLLIHGALHLQGFDHDHVGDARRMEGAETRLLARIGVANPWKNR